MAVLADSTVTADAGIAPRTVAQFALTSQKSKLLITRLLHIYGDFWCGSGTGIYEQIGPSAAMKQVRKTCRKPI
jgi:hypothetical protein